MQSSYRSQIDAESTVHLAKQYSQLPIASIDIWTSNICMYAYMSKTVVNTHTHTFPFVLLCYFFSGHGARKLAVEWVFAEDKSLTEELDYYYY